VAPLKATPGVNEQKNEFDCSFILGSDIPPSCGSLHACYNATYERLFRFVVVTSTHCIVKRVCNKKNEPEDLVSLIFQLVNPQNFKFY
jgi:hypothetical protein